MAVQAGRMGGRMGVGWGMVIMVVGLMGFAAEVVEGQGWWETVVGDAGIATMHAAVTHLGSVVLLDRTNIGPSQLALPAGVCRDNPADRVGCPTYSSVSGLHVYESKSTPQV